MVTQRRISDPCVSSSTHICHTNAPPLSLIGVLSVCSSCIRRIDAAQIVPIFCIGPTPSSMSLFPPAQAVMTDYHFRGQNSWPGRICQNTFHHMKINWHSASLDTCSSLNPDIHHVQGCKSTEAASFDILLEINTELQTHKEIWNLSNLYLLPTHQLLVMIIGINDGGAGVWTHQRLSPSVTSRSPWAGKEQATWLLTDDTSTWSSSRRCRPCLHWWWMVIWSLEGGGYKGPSFSI